MGRLMPSHHGAAGKHLPPLHVLEGLVDRESAGGHHLWNGDFDEEDGMRFAVFRWTPPAKSSVRYVVARALWSYVNDRSLFRRRLRNTCDVTPCVNPAHYEFADTLDELELFTLPHGFVFSDGTSARLVRVGYEPHVHVIRDDASYTSCYRVINKRNATTMIEGTAITCSRCVTEWRDFGRPLRKVP